MALAGAVVQSWTPAILILRTYKDRLWIFEVLETPFNMYPISVEVVASSIGTPTFFGIPGVRLPFFFYNVYINPKWVITRIRTVAFPSSGSPHVYQYVLWMVRRRHLVTL